MSDIVERLEFLASGQGDCPSVAITEAVAEIRRLRTALRHQDDRDGHIGTHSGACHTFGPKHYECALRKIAELEKDSARLDWLLDHALVIHMRHSVPALQSLDRDGIDAARGY